MEIGKLPLFYSFWIQLSYCIFLISNHLGKSSLHTPLSLSIYILNWVVCILGNVVTVKYGKSIVQEHHFSEKVIPLSILIHSIFIIPLIRYIPYKNINISMSTATLTLFYCLLSFSIYLYYLELKKDTIFRIYSSVPINRFVSLSLVCVLVYLYIKLN